MTYRQAFQKVYEKVFDLDDQIKEINKQLTPEVLKEVNDYIALEINNLGYTAQDLKVYYTTFNLGDIEHKKLKKYKLYESLYTKMHVGISLTALNDVSSLNIDKPIPYGILHIGSILDEQYRLHFETDSGYLFKLNLDNIKVEHHELFDDSYRASIRAILRKILKKGFVACPALKYLKTILVKKWRMVINQTLMLQDMIDILEDQLKDTIAVQMRKEYISPTKVDDIMNILTIYFNMFGNELEGYVINYPEASDTSFFETDRTFRLCTIRDNRLLLAYNSKRTTCTQRDIDTYLEKALDTEINIEGFDRAIKRMYSTENKGNQPSAAIYRFLLGKEIPFNVRTGEIVD